MTGARAKSNQHPGPAGGVRRRLRFFDAGDRTISAELGQPPPPAASTTPGPSAEPTAVEFRYTQGERFVTLLHELNASLLVSTYQANKLLIARATGDGLSTLVR